MTEPASLRPVRGAPRALEQAVRGWLAATAPEPLVVRTSGSTGEPKDVLLSQRAVVASARATLARIGGPGQWVLALPANYVAGLQVLVRSVLAGVSPVLLDDGPSLPAAAAALTGARRYLAIVPTQLHRWLADPAATAALRTFDTVLLGGSAAPPGLLDRARAAGIRIVTTYGMSETCGGCVYDGTPLDGVVVAFAPDSRVRVTGPVLFDGYAGDPARTQAVLRDRWFVTADLGRLDADGRLELLGRSDDVVVSGGVNVPLPAVQRVVAAMPEVAECAVVGMPDAEWGSTVVAAVTVSAAAVAPSLAAVRDTVAAELPPAWAPRQLVVLDELPMLASGKLDTASLVARLTGARLSTGSPQ